MPSGSIHDLDAASFNRALLQNDAVQFLLCGIQKQIARVLMNLPMRDLALSGAIPLIFAS